TSQIWNMTFSFYASLVTLPRELKKATAIGWGRFARLRVGDWRRRRQEGRRAVLLDREPQPLRRQGPGRPPGGGALAPAVRADRRRRRRSPPRRGQQRADLWVHGAVQSAISPVLRAGHRPPRPLQSDDPARGVRLPDP